MTEISQGHPAPDRGAGGREPDFAVGSAGTEPKGVNPYAVRVLAEVGIDWSNAESKALGALPRAVLRLRHHRV
jgi:protein-tyrosine-phosphatase